jgi:D-alanyl-D-alanine carboxypeptidase
MLYSDASSAMALAVGACGSVSKFSSKMNRKAKEIGMKKSHFDNPVGLDYGSGYNNTYATAKDFSKLAKYAMENEIISSIAAKAKYRVPKTSASKAFTVKSTNAFYGKEKYAQYKKEKYTIIGLKTGYTAAAGRSLIAVAKNRYGRTIICSFYGASSDKTKYISIKRIFNYVYNH